MSLTTDPVTTQLAPVGTVRPEPPLDGEPTVPVPAVTRHEDPRTGRMEPLRPATGPAGPDHMDRSAPECPTCRARALDRAPAPTTPARSTRSGRGLRTAVVAAATAVVVTGGGVLAAQAGVLHRAVASGTNQATAPAPGLLLATGQQWGSASYRVPGPGFAVSVTDSSRPCWLSIDADGKTVYAGVLNPGSSARATARQSITVQLGAGGASVVVSHSGRSQILQPASAPYRLSLTTE
ncbi:MAG TPA: DUF4115 domain-containing protein [Acidimicrobiales bacterium]|nr:DUF4115 domain-containing protein [Acidimicrobiales bacterium]